jgi:hypothetical protein
MWFEVWLLWCGLQRNIAINAGYCMQGTRSLKQKYVVQLPDKLSALRNQCRSHNLKAVVLIAVENFKSRQDSLFCLATVHKVFWVKVIQAGEREQARSCDQLPMPWWCMHAGYAPRATHRIMTVTDSGRGNSSTRPAVGKSVVGKNVISEQLESSIKCKQECEAQKERPGRTSVQCFQYNVQDMKPGSRCADSDGLLCCYIVRREGEKEARNIAGCQASTSTKQNQQYCQQTRIWDQCTTVDRWKQQKQLGLSEAGSTPTIEVLLDFKAGKHWNHNEEGDKQLEHQRMQLYKSQKQNWIFEKPT